MKLVAIGGTHDGEEIDVFDGFIFNGQPDIRVPEKIPYGSDAILRDDEPLSTGKICTEIYKIIRVRENIQYLLTEKMTEEQAVARMIATYGKMKKYQ